MTVDFYEDGLWMRQDNCTVNSEKDVELIHRMLGAVAKYEYNYTWYTI